jgi:hypothetical protein
MTNPHPRDCDCGFDDDRACPNCSTEAEAQALREELVDNYNDQSGADNDAFADACGQMTQADWDADNDWLASAGWGEM